MVPKAATNCWWYTGIEIENYGFILNMKTVTLPRLLTLLLFACLSTDATAEKRLLWGDTHLHTSYSFDAFLNNNLTADPDTAYRFAKGQPVIHPYHRARVQLHAPLDFLVVSDHAEFLGGLREIYYNGLQQDDAGPIDDILNWYTIHSFRFRCPKVVRRRG